MKIVCDACAAKYSIADEKVAGKVFKIRCKKCSNIIVVRGNADEAAAPAAEEAQPNKDTKVFDYQGYDSPQEAMAADAEWHVVIDQEQVGPMTAAEVRQRFASGEIDGETYIWKEGFADWERIPEVADFADLGGAAQPEAGGMFGAAPVAASPAASADLFGAASASPASGGDLFGNSGASRGGDLFGGGDSVGEHTGEIPMSKEAEAQLKGQRNENSVLFSLGNLAALASDSPKAAPVAASSSKSMSSNTGGSEGSGLIDIRSMASVYLADKGAPGHRATPSGSADDLPVFSQSAFESASPVLLPTQSAGADKKLLYALVGVIAALLVAAVVLVVVVLKGGDKDKPAVATNAAENAAADTEESATEPTEPETPATEVKTEGTETAEPAATETETDPAENNLTAEAGSSTPDKGSKSKSDKGRDKSSNSSSSSSSSSKSKDKTPDRTTKVTPPPEDNSKGGCDEVTCLVDPGKACCKKYNSSSSSSSSSSSKSSGLPEKLSKSDVSAGIGAVKGRVSSCGDKNGGKGTVKVKIKIGGSGKVESAEASGGSEPLRSCVVSAVKRAKFKKTEQGMSVTYPFVFR